MTLLELMIGIVIGFIFGYITSYFKQKGKNKALLSDISRLTQEKETVKANFQLDIEKRKYKYESKKEQYFKYFNFIDEFSARSGKEMYDIMFPIIDEFNKNYLAADGDKDKELVALNDFSSKINKVVYKSNEELIKIKNETNAIKLIAGDRVIKELTKLEKLYDLSSKMGSDMLRELGQNIISGNYELLLQQQSELSKLGNEILTTKEKLIEEVRRELDEI